MLRSRDATIRCLHAPERGLRLAALSLIAEYWPATEPFAAEALRLAFEDADPIVQARASNAPVDEAVRA